jgi:hypothetical protein
MMTKHDNFQSNKSTIIRAAQKQKIHNRQFKIIDMLKNNHHIQNIHKICSTSLKNIYQITQNNNLSLPSKQYKSSIPFDVKQDDMMLNIPKYPKNFTIFYRDSFKKPTLPAHNQCQFIMTDKNNIDYYCPNNSIEILTKKNYCLECYFKAHIVSDKQKQQIIKQNTLFNNMHTGNKNG